MKKLLLLFVFFISLPLFSQIEPKVENRKIIDEDSKSRLYKLNDGDFVFANMMVSEKEKKNKIWKIARYGSDLSVVWEKVMNLEKEFELITCLSDDKKSYLIFDYKDEPNNKNVIVLIATIDAEGVVTKKEFPLSNYSVTSNYYLVDNNIYFAHTEIGDNYKRENRIRSIDLENYKMSELMLTGYPRYSITQNFTFHDNTFYSRIEGNKDVAALVGTPKKPEFNSIYTFQQGKQIAVLPIKTEAETRITHYRFLPTDSTHLFVFGIVEKYIKGSRNNPENYDYRIFLNRITKDDLELINILEPNYYADLAYKPTIKFKNNSFLEQNLMDGNNYVVNNSFRMGNNNYIVFDKYQVVFAPNDPQQKRTKFIYTNTIIFCFNDNAEMLWSKNINYTIIGTTIGTHTYAYPINSNTIGLTGPFDDKYSTITISADGKEVKGNENLETISAYDLDADYKISSKLTSFDKNRFVIFEPVPETIEQEKMRRKQKNYNIGADLKVFDVK